MSESVYSSMQMNTGFDGSMIDQLLETAEEKKEKEDEELEIERKYYQKPDPATDPLQAGNFLRTFVQGMMQRMGELELSELDKYLNAIQLAGAYTVNPHSTFIKDPGGSGKMIKFTMPLDLRSVEEKMQSYPFVGAEGRFRAQYNQENSIYSNARSTQ